MNFTFCQMPSPFEILASSRRQRFQKATASKEDGCTEYYLEHAFIDLSYALLDTIYDEPLFLQSENKNCLALAIHEILGAILKATIDSAFSLTIPDHQRKTTSIPYTGYPFN